MERSILIALVASSCCFGWSALDGHLQGVVVDERGQPIEGVDVAPFARSYGRDGIGEDLPDAVTATTGRDGRFEISGLCLYSDRAIRFAKDGYQTGQIDPPFATQCGSGSTREVRFTLHAAQ